MLLHLLKSAKDALNYAFNKKVPKPDHPMQRGVPPDDDAIPPRPVEPSGKSASPTTTIVILGVVVVVALYIEWHLLAIAAGILLAVTLIGYLAIQKTVDAANLAVPDPSPGPWPWPTSDSMGAA